MQSLTIAMGLVVVWSAAILGPYWAVLCWRGHQEANKGGP